MINWTIWILSRRLSSETLSLWQKVKEDIASKIDVIVRQNSFWNCQELLLLLIFSDEFDIFHNFKIIWAGRRVRFFFLVDNLFILKLYRCKGSPFLSLVRRSSKPTTSDSSGPASGEYIFSPLLLFALSNWNYYKPKL